MTRTSTIFVAAIGAAAVLAAGPAAADGGQDGLKETWRPARGEIQRRNYQERFHDRKDIKTLSAIWDRLGEDGFHDFHDVRKGEGWISCLAWKDGHLYRIRMDSKTGSVIGTRKVR